MNTDRHIHISANHLDQKTEMLIAEFSTRHNFNSDTLRRLIRANPLVGPAQVLAELEKKITATGMVLIDSRAGTQSRAKRRQQFNAGRRGAPIRTGGKLRTQQDRKRAEKVLKDFRRRSDAAAKRKAG